jgi:hypothetical protein
MVQLGLKLAEINTARKYLLLVVGVSGTSGIARWGFAYPGYLTANTETWNGSSWTEVIADDLPQLNRNGSANGTQTAAL